MVTVPLTARWDAGHGGRWTSLSGGGREWLWHRPAPGRHTVRPGDPFVDAGGLEECLPTVRGRPDHGAVWSRPWRPDTPDHGDPAALVVETPGFVLRRHIEHRAGAVVADYRLSAPAGFRFVWAAHALLDLSPAARLDAPAGTRTRVYPDADPPADGPWPAPAGIPLDRPDPDPPAEGPWPAPAGTPLDRLGPDDGTAVGAILVGCARSTVVDGADRLTFALECDGQPLSTALWRNLRGWPAPEPYRSIGVEPMLGAAFDVAEDAPVAVVPAGGAVAWRLTLTAERAR
ncbi:hypothetical protein [Dactylosporangium sp. CA-092794]|uniref:hypothetical protein n=1 Tax=Dactylosporangium sp. CA-092794 TaxID=3239929 RepID=UPI003D8EECBE